LTADQAGTGGHGVPSALITGATGGIGTAIAERLALIGYRLTLSGRDENTLSELAGKLSSAGVELNLIQADMAAEADVRALARGHADRFGALDMLVLCAGTGTSGLISGYPMHRFDRQLAVNLRAPFALVQECLPALRKAAAARPAHGARIAAIASLAGIASEPGLAAYSATKAALISLCQSVNSEESSGGVSATAIAPGYVDTDMSAWIRGEVDPAAMIRPSDIAELVVTLTRLSASAVIPTVAVSRPGPSQWRA
jgi:3-oxoacyl-[acyl-carrier protein] reductase